MGFLVDPRVMAFLVVWDLNRGSNLFHFRGGIQTTGPQTTNLPLVDGWSIQIINYLEVKSTIKRRVLLKQLSFRFKTIKSRRLGLPGYINTLIKSLLPYLKIEHRDIHVNCCRGFRKCIRKVNHVKYMYTYIYCIYDYNLYL